MQRTTGFSDVLLCFVVIVAVVVVDVVVTVAIFVLKLCVLGLGAAALFKDEELLLLFLVTFLRALLLLPAASAIAFLMGVRVHLDFPSFFLFLSVKEVGVKLF